MVVKVWVGSVGGWSFSYGGVCGVFVVVGLGVGVGICLGEEFVGFEEWWWRGWLGLYWEDEFRGGGFEFL